MKVAQTIWIHALHSGSGDYYKQYYISRKLSKKDDEPTPEPKNKDEGE